MIDIEAQTLAFQLDMIVLEGQGTKILNSYVNPVEIQVFYVLEKKGHSW